MSLVALIASKRDLHGWSLKDLVRRAARLGYPTDKGQWSRYANGRARPLDPQSIVKVAAGLGEDPAVVYTAVGVDLGVAPEWLTSAVAELVAQMAGEGRDVVHFAEETVTSTQLAGALARARMVVSRMEEESASHRPHRTVPRPARPSDARDPSARKP